MNDVLVEGLQVLKFSALHFQFRAVAAQGLRQQAGKIGHGHKVK